MSFARKRAAAKSGTKVGYKPDTLDHFVDHICRFGAPEGPGRAVSAVVGRNAVDASDCAS